MKSFLTLLLAACALQGTATAETPVTQAEAAAVFAKAEKVMKTVLRYPGKNPEFSGGSGVVTRAQVLSQFVAIYAVIQPKFTFTAPLQKSEPNLISFKDARTKQMALRMEVMGFIDRFGPLATSKTESLTPAEFGDAIGHFMARAAELTHTPSSQFSPYLMRG